MGQFDSELSGIQLQNCCKEALELIRVKLEVGKVLERFLIPAVFVSLFVSPSKGSALTTASSIYGTDWEMLAKATIGIGLITKKQVRDVADFEQLKHNGQLRYFWSSVHDAFL
jgi:hypothetical protein